MKEILKEIIAKTGPIYFGVENTEMGLYPYCSLEKINVSNFPEFNDSLKIATTFFDDFYWFIQNLNLEEFSSFEWSLSVKVKKDELIIEMDKVSRELDYPYVDELDDFRDGLNSLLLKYLPSNFCARFSLSGNYGDSTISIIEDFSFSFFDDKMENETEIELTNDQLKELSKDLYKFFEEFSEGWSSDISMESFDSQIETSDIDNMDTSYYFSEEGSSDFEVFWVFLNNYLIKN